MKYHINNKISKREIRKQGKNVIPLELMKYDPNRSHTTDDNKSPLGDVHDRCDKDDLLSGEGAEGDD